MTTKEAIDMLDGFQRQIIHGKNTFGEIADVIRGLESLQLAALELSEIVDGVRAQRWSLGVTRLKDTPEWCAFYCALQFRGLKS